MLPLGDLSPMLAGIMRGYPEVGYCISIWSIARLHLMSFDSLCVCALSWYFVPWFLFFTAEAGGTTQAGLCVISSVHGRAHGPYHQVILRSSVGMPYAVHVHGKTPQNHVYALKQEPEVL